MISSNTDNKGESYRVLFLFQPVYRHTQVISIDVFEKIKLNS